MPRDHTFERRTLSPSPAEAAPPPGSVIVPFPPRAGRPARPAPRTGETRGEVVLFLGVRYERLAS